MKQTGKVYLVGAGPGAAGLITVRGMELIQRCDALVYDYLGCSSFLPLVKEGCQTICVGKRAGSHSMKQEAIHQRLIQLAKQGLLVVRLKGGDPFVFGRGGEEVLALKEAGISWELVPGVSSAIAVPELAGIPVTHRLVSRSFHVITGHTMETPMGKKLDMTPYGTLEGTLVFLMGFGHLADIAGELIKAGKRPDTPSAVIENGSLASQRLVRAPLNLLAEEAHKAGLKAPALIVVGEAAACDFSCKPFLPLSGMRVGMVGTSSFLERFERALLAQGAQARRVLELTLCSHADSSDMKKAYQTLSSYTWIVFTSVNGVRLFFQGLLKQNLDVRSLGSLKLAVIGPGTRNELKKYGFLADFMPDTYCASSLARGLISQLTGEDRLLLARSGEGSKELTELLKKAGIFYDDISLYELSAEKKHLREQREDLSDLDYLVFASGSGVRACLGYLPWIAKKERMPKLVCIGTVTADTLLKAGIQTDLTAASFDIEGLIEILTEDACHKKFICQKAENGIK